MSKGGYEHGSSRLGAVFMASVFGPMLILAIIWALTIGVGASGSTRDFFGGLMVWVLMGAGVIITLEEIALLVVQIFIHPSIAWPDRSDGLDPAADTPQEATSPPGPPQAS